LGASAGGVASGVGAGAGVGVTASGPGVGAGGVGAGAGAGVTASGEGVVVGSSAGLQPISVAARVKPEKVPNFKKFNFTGWLLHWKSTRGAVFVSGCDIPDVNELRTHASTRTPWATRTSATSHRTDYIGVRSRSQRKRTGRLAGLASQGYLPYRITRRSDDRFHSYRLMRSTRSSHRSLGRRPAHVSDYGPTTSCRHARTY
jgi:hypothetical protein